MRRALLLLGLLLYPASSFAQAPATGLPPYGSFQPGAFDTVNRQNLNANFAISIVSLPARSTDFSFAIVYDTLIWRNGGSGSNWTVVTDPSGVGTWGWKVRWPIGAISYNHSSVVRHVNCGTRQDPYVVDLLTETWSNYAYTDPAGTVHSFTVSRTQAEQCDGSTTVSGSSTGYATNGSGFFISIAANPGAPFVRSPQGTTITSSSLTDTNGNMISQIVVNSAETDWKDTANHTALRIVTVGSNLEYHYLDSSGTDQKFTLKYQNYSIKTNFACTGITDYNLSGTMPQVSLPYQLDLPNGRSFAFTYEPTPGSTGFYTGRLKRVTLPTGGYYEYQYPAANPATDHGGINCADAAVNDLTRVISDGTNTLTWHFARAQNGSNWNTTVDPPQLSYDTAANQSVFTFNSSRQEITEKFYQGSATLLRTVNVTWAANGTPATRTTILEDNSTRNQVETTFDSNGNLLTLKEHDWGVGSPGSVKRTTTWTYLTDSNYTSRNIVNRVTQIQVRDGDISGPVKSRTDITYDGATAFSGPNCITGAPQHDDTGYGCTFLFRGNAITVTKYSSPSGPTGPVTLSFEYDSLGNLRKATDAGSHQTTFSYTDSWGDTGCPPPADTQAFPTQITNALNQSTQIKYYQCTGQVHSVKDPNDIANSRNGTVFTYADPLKRPTKADFPDGGQTTFGYDDTLRTITTTQKQTATVSVSETDQFDQLGRLIQRQLPGGRKVDAVYDSLGGAWKTSNPYISTGDPTYGLSEIQYDPLGRVKKLIHQDGVSFTLLEYTGNAARVTDDSGKKRLAVADALGRVTKVCEVTAGNARSPNEACGISGFTENGYLTTNTFDVLDNVTQTVQGTAAPQQQTRTMAYDGLGRITNARVLEVSTATDVTYGYDLDSNPTSVTDPRGTVNFEYDALHRLVRKKHGATIVAEYSYDGTAANNAIGRLITDTDGVAGSGADHSDYTFDPLGRILTANRTVSGTPYTIGYQYDLMGNLTQLTYPSGRKVSYTYTSANEVNKVSDTTSTSFDYVTGASYSPLGTLQQLNLANQVTTALGWNNLARLTSILTQKPGNPALLNFAYTYFANGQIQQITNNLDSLKTEKYGYDDLGRLLTAQRGPDNNIQRKYEYDYDRFGNRWLQSLVAGTQGYGGQNSFDYGSNRVTSPNFSFDAFGNITANGAGTSFAFNPENFITAAGTSITYSVDTLGRRTKKTVSGTTTNHFYSGSVVISEKQGTTWTDYIFFADQRIAQQTGSALATAKFLHQDHLGSTRVYTDGSGNSAGSCDYEPFGEFQPGSSCSALPTNYRFAGMEYDSETGLYHTWFRQYDPNQGRWMGVDPLAGSPGNPQSLDRYAYVFSNPINLIDPLGLDNDCGGPCTPFSYTDSNGCTVYVTYHKEKGEDGQIYDIPDVTTVCSICPIGDRPGTPRCVDPQHTPEVVPYRILRRIRDRETGTLDNRAAALANALNNTGVQLVANPCAVGGFYLLSAVGGVAANWGGVLAIANETFAPYALPVTGWAFRRVARGVGVLTVLNNIPSVKRITDSVSQTATDVCHE